MTHSAPPPRPPQPVGGDALDPRRPRLAALPATLRREVCTALPRLKDALIEGETAGSGPQLSCMTHAEAVAELRRHGVTADGVELAVLAGAADLDGDGLLSGLELFVKDPRIPTYVKIFSVFRLDFEHSS